MKFISWNVNGFRACLTKGFADFFAQADADIFCIQESKMQPDQADFAPEGYHCYWHSAIKKGYSGTAVFTKQEPLSVTYGLNGEHLDEGRAITYRMEFEDAMRAYLSELDKKKPVVYCGDLNVAHNEIDLKNPKSNAGNAGFSDEERGKFNELLAAGFSDSFRTLYPDTVTYSWWSYRFKAREKNAGWRIDYFVVSERLMSKVADSRILTDIMGSDHCPVELDIEL